MTLYQIDEMDGEALAASHTTSAETALEAVQKITGKAVSPRALQRHWYRVVDENEGSIFEFSAEPD